MKVSLLIIAILLASCTRTEYVAVETVRVVEATWRTGGMPVGRPVVGAWIAGDSMLYRTVVLSQHGQHYEYWGGGRTLWPVGEPDYWMIGPE